MADINIGGTLHSTATGNIAVRANEVMDTSKNKKQSQINTETSSTLAEHESRLNAMSTQNYITVEATALTSDVTDVLPEVGAGNTIYRVGSWDGSQFDENAYSEYAWDVDTNTYKLLDVKEYTLAEASDFNNPTPTQEAKIPTVGAVLGGISDGVFDLTAKTGDSYASLSAALTAANTAIPSNKKKGGMSIKFALSSDNKYVQYRCIAGEFTTDVTQWAIVDEGVYVENPEFIYVKTDRDGKILWAIKADGDIYYGAGVPPQVVNYINEKIADLSLDEYEDIVAFLNDLEKGDKTLQTLLDEKVDKEEGKSLIDAEYANGVRYIENPEFAEVKVDNEDRILEAIMKDGTKLLPAGVKVIGTAEYDGATIKTVENPEFAGVWLDGEDKVLFGVEQDGNFLFGCGVPRQVKEYIEQKIEELSLDEYESIVAFIGDYLNNTTLEELLSKKVDGEYVENPEFIEAKVDAEDKVLEGIQKDGTKVIGGDIRVLGDMEVSGVSYKIVKSPEYLAAWLDAEDKVLFGLKTDGKTYIGDADFLNDIKDNQEAIAEIKTTLATIGAKVDSLDIDALSSITVVENPEFIEAKTDAEGKLLAGRTNDGAAFEKVGFSTPQISIDGHNIENIEDPEGRSEITTDSEGKIISYRDSDGVKHENVGVETNTLKAKSVESKTVIANSAEIENAEVNSLTLSEEGMNEFIQTLIDSGFNTTGISDWSNKSELHIKEPYCAIINFSGISSMPQTKTTDAHAYMEFWDMAGNYFKKEVIANAQGRSTMSHPKKNIAIDICNNNGWDDDDTFSLQIGDWVPQDSFHLKAFYNDPFRCLCPVAYQLNDEILKTRGEHNDYVWKRALLDLDDITPTSTGCETAEDAIEGWNTNARCFPMGFPCIVYLNGDFYGIYSWQLKKHRDNYQMSKKKTKHIHLDGIISLDKILNANGDTTKICWTTDSPEGIEIRNPKPKKKKDGWDLVLLNGEKYDADANGGEIMSSTMIVEGEEIANPNWDSTNESHVKSYEVKQYILNMSKIIPTLADAYSTYQASSKTDEDKAAFKEVFETYFDVNNLIDYLILSDVLANYDGFSQNVQWITYNGVKWYLCAYDLDGVMGNWWQLNDTIVAPRTVHYNYAQFQYLPIFYENELNARYKELRDKGIIDVNYIYGLVENWLKRVGAKETFEKEWEKWSGFIKNDNVHRLYKWLQISISNMDILYNYN